MRKTNIEGFSRLPFTNPKFNKFFEAQKGISADLKAIFDVNTINNERFNELPHNIYFGEDITEVFSNDGLVDFICQLDNNGVSKAILGSFSNRTLESTVHYNFTFSDNPSESNYSVIFTKYEHDADFVKSTSGVEIYSPSGLQSTLYNTLVSSAVTGEMLEARSTYGYYDSKDQLCTETLVFEYPTQIENPQSNLLEFRQEMAEGNATAVYLVDGKRPEMGKVDEIIRTTEQAIGSQTTESLIQ